MWFNKSTQILFQCVQFRMFCQWLSQFYWGDSERHHTQNWKDKRRIIGLLTPRPSMITSVRCHSMQPMSSTTLTTFIGRMSGFWMMPWKIMHPLKNACPKYKGRLTWTESWGVLFSIHTKLSKVKQTGNNTGIREMLPQSLRSSLWSATFWAMCRGSKSKDFWPTINVDVGTPTVLSEGWKVVTDQTEVCGILNAFIINVAKDIGTGGKQYALDLPDQTSIINIKENLPKHFPPFSFKPVNQNEAAKIISKLNIKITTGLDNISAKILKACGPAVSHTVSNLIISLLQYQNSHQVWKDGQVLPLHKKKDPLEKENFRPVSFLNTTSKI